MMYETLKLLMPHVNNFYVGVTLTEFINCPLAKTIGVVEGVEYIGLVEPYEPLAAKEVLP